MSKEPVVIRGVLGWGNRKNGCEAYGPFGRWMKDAENNSVSFGPNDQYGDLLGDALEREGMSEGADLIVVAVPRQCAGTYEFMAQIATKLHAAMLEAVDEVMADYGPVEG